VVTSAQGGINVYVTSLTLPGLLGIFRVCSGFTIAILYYNNLVLKKDE